MWISKTRWLLWRDTIEWHEFITTEASYRTNGFRASRVDVDETNDSKHNKLIRSSLHHFDRLIGVILGKKMSPEERVSVLDSCLLRVRTPLDRIARNYSSESRARLTQRREKKSYSRIIALETTRTRLNQVNKRVYEVFIFVRIANFFVGK